jgi:hypothetical protein
VTRTGLPKLRQWFDNTSRGEILAFLFSTRQRQNDINSARVTAVCHAVKLTLEFFVATALWAVDESIEVPFSRYQVLRNQKKLSCVWIFHDGPGRKIGDIDILSLIRGIRTGDHAFAAWDRNSIGQISFCFFDIRG